jgi:hypothetical protein
MPIPATALVTMAVISMVLGDPFLITHTHIDPFPTSMPRSMIVGVNNLANWTYTYDASRSHITKGEFVASPPHTIEPHGAKPASGTYGWEIKADKNKEVRAN